MRNNRYSCVNAHMEMAINAKICVDAPDGNSMRGVASGRGGGGRSATGYSFSVAVLFSEDYV
jgi:hypothetical protein